MVAAAPCASWRSFRDSLKVLEANIQHANTLASECSRDYDRACLQMRMSYSPAVRIFLFLMQWTNCSLAGAVGLLRILLFMWMAPPPCPPTKGRPASGSSTVNALYITENNSRCCHYENTKGRLVGLWFGKQSFTRTEYDEQAWMQEISPENRT